MGKHKRERGAALGRLAELLVELLREAEVSDDERTELADLLVTAGLPDNHPKLDELDPVDDDGNPDDDDDQADEGLDDD